MCIRDSTHTQNQTTFSRYDYTPTIHNDFYKVTISENLVYTFSKLLTLTKQRFGYLIEVKIYDLQRQQENRKADVHPNRKLIHLFQTLAAVSSFQIEDTVINQYRRFYYKFPKIDTLL